LRRPDQLQFDDPILQADAVCINKGKLEQKNSICRKRQLPILSVTFRPAFYSHEYASKASSFADHLRPNTSRLANSG